MHDVMFVALAISFFGLAAAYVRACAAVVGPELPGPTELENPSDEPEVAA